MRKNKLIALIGTLTMAAAGLAAVSAGVSSKKADSVNAAGEYEETVRLELNSSIWGSANAYYTIHYWGGESQGSTWPGARFGSGSGSNILTATWDKRATNCIIARFSDSSCTTEWNRWDYFNANSFTAGQYNYFINDGWTSCNSAKKYEIKYNAGGASGTVPSSSIENANSSITLPSKGSLTKGTDVFAGWSDGSQTYAAGASYTLAKDVTFTAQWETPAADTYSVAYHSNNGASLTVTNTYEVGQDTTAIAKPSEFANPERKRFNGWALSASSTTSDYYPGDPINSRAKDEVLNLYAVYDNAFYIRNFTQGWDSEFIWNSTLNQFEGTIDLEEGDEFKIVQYTDKTTIGSYYANIQSGEAHPESAMNHDQMSGGGSDPTYAPNIKAEVAGNYSVYMKDSDCKIYIPYNHFSVTYHANGGTVGSVPDEQEDKVGCGKTEIVRAANTYAAPAGKLFRGWNTNAEGTGTTYDPGEEISLEKNGSLDLYAIFTNKNPADGYYVIGQFNGTPVTRFPMTKVDGKDEYTITSPSLVAGNYFKFAHFFNEAPDAYYGIDQDEESGQNKTAVEAGQLKVSTDGEQNYEVVIPGSYTGYLKPNATEGNRVWIEAIKYNVVYHANGVTGDDITNPYNVGTATTAIANPYDVPQHHTFLGWNTLATGDGDAYDVGDPIASRAQGSTLHLYAQWDVSTASYSVTYNTNGGSGTITTDSIEVGTGFTTKASNFFSFANHQFVEWNTEANGSGDSYDPNTAYPSLEDGDALTLYAIWRDNVPSDGYYVEINGTTRQALSLKQGSTTEYEGSFTLAVDDQFVIANYLDESRTATWGYQDLQGQDGTARAKGQLVEGTSDAIKAAAPGTYTVAFHTDYGSGRTYVPALADSYTISINGVSQPLVAHEGNEIKTASAVNVEAGDVLAVYNNGLLQTMNPKFVSNNNCKSVEGVSTVIVDGTGTIYVDKVNNTIFVGGFDAETFYMVVTDSNGSNYVKLNKNATPQSDCDEYLTQGEYSFTKDDVISYINTGSNDGHIVPFDVATVDEASLNTNFETSGTKIVCNKTTDSFAYLKLGKEAHQGENTVYFGNIDVQKALDFAKKFVTDMNAVCKAPEGQTDYDYPWHPEIGTTWANLNAEYELIDDDGAYTILRTAEPTSPYKAIAYFADFYDYVYSKYENTDHKLDDFAGRFTEDDGKGQHLYGNANNKLISVNDVSTSTWIIATVAFVGIAAVGVFFIYRKRKEN